MNAWDDWAANLATICHGWVRPPGLFSMTSNQELCFLENYARYSYTGAGDIVDLGCWLGATSYVLARGLADNAARPWDQPIDAIDRFVWEPWMNDIAGHMRLPPTHHVGQSFLDEARALLAPYASLVRLRPLDLLESEPHPRPVEFLFVDAMKSWPLADRIARNYFPKLIAGRSIVVHQDFAWTAAVTATNHLLMWLLRDWLVPVYHVPASCSVAFFCVHAVPPSAIGHFTEGRFGRDEIAQAFDYGAACVSPDMRSSVRLCEIAYLAERGFNDAVLAAVRSFIASGYRVERWQLQPIESLLQASGGNAGEHGSRVAAAEATRLLASAAR